MKARITTNKPINSSLDKFYELECTRICREYPKEMQRVFSYQRCELQRDFLGFLHVYKGIQVPAYFTIIDLGCNQAVQAQYFKHCRCYIGVDSSIPNSTRFPQPNAQYFRCTIQQFILDILPTMGLSMSNVLAVCSYVPDADARKLVADTFPFARVVYGDEVICDRLPQGW